MAALGRLLVAAGPFLVQSETFFEGAQNEILLDGCFFKNHRYKGDLVSTRPSHTKTHFECQKQCQSIERCKYFGFFQSSKECWLAGEKANYENWDSEGCISGPKYCTIPPAGCSGRPSPGWPAATYDRSENMWPDHRQPTKLECWPRNKSKGFYGSCPTRIVLEDAAYGWPAKCDHLQKAFLKHGETCEQKCIDRLRCAVFVIRNDTEQGCYHGDGFNCFSNNAQPAALKAKRIMHGKIRVLANATGYQILGLYRAFDQYYFVDLKMAAEACRNACYSIIDCDIWQYSIMFGCWIENSQIEKTDSMTNLAGSGMVPYPYTQETWRKDSKYADTFIYGEYIQRLCPGTDLVPTSFTDLIVPLRLQFGPPPDDYYAQEIARLKREFPDVEPARPATGTLMWNARLDEEKTTVAGVSSSWHVQYGNAALRLCGLVVLISGFVVAASIKLGAHRFTRYADRSVVPFMDVEG